MDPYVKYLNKNKDNIIASEACGGVVESNMTQHTEKYIPTTLSKYIFTLTGNIYIGYNKVG